VTTAEPYSALTLGIMLDEVLGSAVNAIRPEGTHSVTSELSVDFVRVGDQSVRVLHGMGQVLAIRPDCGLAGGEVRDQDGEIVAVGTTWCRFGAGAVELTDAPIPPSDLRLDGLLGIDGARAVLQPSPLCANELGTLHGGVALAVAHDVALARLASILAEPKATSVRVNYLRPGRLDEPIEYESVITHAGRTVAVVTVRGLNSAGKTTTLSTVTARA
jgi:acyl-coenzyme A thioesterase PaaI-like protein